MCCPGRRAPEAVALAERLLDALGTTALPAAARASAPASASPCRRRACSARPCCRNADAAMYLAKERGPRAGPALRRRRARDRHEHARVEQELTEAIDNDELEVHYQPMVDLGRPAPSTASRRWSAGGTPSEAWSGPTPSWGWPSRAGLIVAIGAGVLDQACATAVGGPRPLDGAADRGERVGPAARRPRLRCGRRGRARRDTGWRRSGCASRSPRPR